MNQRNGVFCMIEVGDPRDDAGRAIEALLELLRPTIETVTIDAYPSELWPKFRGLPAEVREAQGLLAARGRNRSKSESRDPLMAVSVRMADPDAADAIRRFAAYSIHVEAHDFDGAEVFACDDEGSVTTAILTTEEIASLRAVGIEVSIAPGRRARRG